MTDRSHIKYTISRAEAENLLSWIGNNGIINDDVMLYDGWEDNDGIVYFGFSSNDRFTTEEAVESMMNAIEICASRRDGEGNLNKFSFAASRDKEETLKNLRAGASEGVNWSAEYAIFTNIELTR